MNKRGGSVAEARVPPRSRRCGGEAPRGGTPVCGTSAPAAGGARTAQSGASGGLCQVGPRAAAGGKMAAVKGLETCLRVAGAAAARPERFLRYRGAARGWRAPERRACVRVALRDLCGPRCSGREGRRQASCRPVGAPQLPPGSLCYPRGLRALLERAVSSFCLGCCSVLLFSSAFGK